MSIDDVCFFLTGDPSAIQACITISPDIEAPLTCLMSVTKLHNVFVVYFHRKSQFLVFFIFNTLPTDGYIINIV